MKLDTILKLCLLLFTVSCGSDADFNRETTGANCYDLTGDRNLDGDINALDCVGPTGMVGPEGQVGPSGPAGPQGEQGNVGDVGTPGQDGADGEPGPQGERGEQGEQGEQGPAGAPGKAEQAELVYEGYLCGRLVLRMDDQYWVVIGNLIPLSKSWYNVSATCKLRVRNKMVQEHKS